MFRTVLVCSLVSLCLVGCSTERPTTVPVTGKVTFAGGRCPAAGHIAFTPLEPAVGFPRRPGSGSFATDGEFTITSFEAGDGLVPGRYRVQLECWKTLPDEKTGAPGVSYISTPFLADELVIELGSSQAVVANYDVPLRKQE